MAKFPALIKAAASVDDRELKTIEHIGRVIREAGYVPTTKRGSGAADMSTREAVNMLIALNCGVDPKQTPLEVDRFRSLRTHGFPLLCELPEVFDRVNQTETFGEALGALIEGAPRIVEFDPTITSVAPSKRLSVTLHRYFAKLTYEVIYNNETLWEARFNMDANLMVAGFYKRPDADRRVSIVFGVRTLLAMHTALDTD